MGNHPLRRIRGAGPRGSRRGHQFRGGGGRWPRLFRCVPGAWPGSDRWGRPSRGRAGQSLPVGRRAGGAVLGPSSPGDASPCYSASDQRLDGEEATRRIARSASGIAAARIQMRKHQTRLRKTQYIRCMSRKRPPERSGGRLRIQRLARAQLAATSRPLRCCIATTFSTSASAATRASATHLLSTALRECE